MGAIQQALVSYGGSAPASAYLDSLAVVPSCVLSLRKMISTATNSIRVRRSSDNAEQDIGFIGNILDTVSLTTFVGINSAFVTTIYDQTGNGEHALQATSSNQPRIVNSGVIDLGIVWDGTNDWMRITSLAQGSQFASIYTKIQQANAAVFKMMFEAGADGRATSGAFALYIDNQGTTWAMAAGNTGGGTSSSFNVTNVLTLTQMTALYNRSLSGINEIKLYRAGVLTTANTSSLNDQSGNFTSMDMNIGARNAASLFANMTLDTVAFYNLDTAAIQTSIEAIVA